MADPIARVVLCCMADLAQDRNGRRIIATIQAVADACGRTRAVARGAQERLLKAGLLKDQGRGDFNARVRVYTVNEDVLIDSHGLEMSSGKEGATAEDDSENGMLTGTSIGIRPRSDREPYTRARFEPRNLEQNTKSAGEPAHAVGTGEGKPVEPKAGWASTPRKGNQAPRKGNQAPRPWSAAGLPTAADAVASIEADSEAEAREIARLEAEAEAHRAHIESIAPKPPPVAAKPTPVGDKPADPERIRAAFGEMSGMLNGSGMGMGRRPMPTARPPIARPMPNTAWNGRDAVLQLGNAATIAPDGPHGPDWPGSRVGQGRGLNVAQRGA
jgi:hypothetical protein